MTYLQIVNAVLLRLRESSVGSVTSTTYSEMIGALVNDAKRQVEDAFNWDALSTELSVTMIPGTSTYTLIGSGIRHKGSDVNNITNKNRVQNVPIQWIKDQQQLSTVQAGAVVYYAWAGVSATRDSKIEVFPTPNAEDQLVFNLYVPQATLVNDLDVLLVPSDAVVAGAYARALVERGEDGGLSSSEAYGLYKGILGDQIAIESSRFVENDCWSAA